MLDYPGFFITLEGGDGTGKSTLSKHLATVLEKQGYQVVVTREPGGSEGAELIRSLLVTGKKDRWDAITEYLLLSAARRDHCQKTILPALNQGHIVICDRFFDSSLAYQGYGYGLDQEMMTQIYNWIAPAFSPDLTLLLDLDPKRGLERSLQRVTSESRYEDLSLEFHERVRQGFLKLAAKEPQRYGVLDGALPAESLRNQAGDILLSFIESHRKVK
jgi:dTMP kinase